MLLDLDHYITIKRNCRKAHDIDETGITVHQLTELINALDELKNFVGNMYVYPDIPASTRKAANELYNKYFAHKKEKNNE